MSKGNNKQKYQIDRFLRYLSIPLYTMSHTITNLMEENELELHLACNLEDLDQDSLNYLDLDSIPNTLPLTDLPQLFFSFV